MKKLISFKVVGLFLLVLALMLIVGCEKDPLVVIPTQYTIDASTGPHGTFIPKVGQILVEKGKNQALTPIPDPGYELETMIVDGDDVTSKLVNNTYPFNEVASNHTAYATFKKIAEFTVDISVGPNGEVTPDGTFQLAEGTKLFINVKPDPGYKATISGVDDTEITSFGDISVIVNRNLNIVVSFEKTPLWYLIQGPWTLTSWIVSGYMIGRGDYYWEADFTTRDSTFVHTATFDSKNWVKSYHLDGNTKWDYPYRITEDSLKVGDMVYKIVELTEERLVLKSLMGYGDETGQLGYLDSVEVFEHK